MKRISRNRLSFAFLFCLGFPFLAAAQNHGSEHFGSLRLDAPLATTSGGVGNTTGDASSLTVLNGSVQRTLSALFSETVDATLYGVVCDYVVGIGGTDNTAPLAAAIAAAQNNSQFGGKKLVLPAGKCLSGPQTVTGQISIEGQGTFVTQLVLKSGSTTPLLTFASAYSPNFSTTSDALTFARNFSITSVDGASAYNASNDASGIRFATTGSTFFYLYDINVLNMPNNGMETSSTNVGGIELFNPILNWNGAWGLATNSTNDTVVRGAQIYFNGNGANHPAIPAAGGGWLSSGDGALYIEDINSFYNNGPGGWFYGPQNVTIKGHSEYNGNVAQGIFISSGTAGSQLTFDTIGFGGNSRLSAGTYADLEIFNGSGKLVMNGALFPANNAAGGGTSGYNVLIDSGATMTAECHSCFFPAGSISTAGVTNNTTLFTEFGGDGGTLSGGLNVATATQYKGITLGNGSNNTVVMQGTTTTNDGALFALQMAGVPQFKLSANSSISSYILPNIGFGGQTSPVYPVDVTGAIHATAAPLFDALTGFVSCNGALGACSASTAINPTSIGATTPATGAFTQLSVVNPTQYKGQTWGNGANNFAVLEGTTAVNDYGVFALQGAGVAQIKLSAGNGVSSYVIPNIGFGGQTSPAYPVDVTGQVNASAGYRAGGVAGVSCAAGTVNLSTFTVTNGIVTHC